MRILERLIAWPFGIAHRRVKKASGALRPPPYVSEIEQAANALGMRTIHTSLTKAVMTNPTAGALRNELLAAEQTPAIFSGATYWDLTPKYRFDMLAKELATIADRIALSAAMAKLQQPHLAGTSTPPYAPTLADVIFWNELENGFRLVSSGWDRIVLLLDLVLNLGLDKNASLRNSIKAIGKLPCSSSEEYKSIKTFYDGPFQSLEAKQSKGIRHESTHLVSIYTRFLFEFLESLRASPPPDRLNPDQLLDQLVEHYHLYLSGIEKALALIAACQDP